MTSNTTFCLHFLKEIVLPHFQSLFGKNKRGVFWENESKIYEEGSYVPTLPIWKEDSRFDRTGPVLLFLPEIFRFEIILAGTSDIYEFLKSMTLFANSMWKT